MLAKASALAGALVGGLYLGTTAWLLTQRGVLAQVSDNLPQAVLGTAGSILFVAAALWLERSCRVPRPPRDSEGHEAIEQEEDDQVA